MLNAKMKRSRKIWLAALLAAALGYYLFAGKVDENSLLSRPKAFVAGATDAFLSSAAVTSIKNTFGRIEAKVTGTTNAARATADADSKGTLPH